MARFAAVGRVLTYRNAQIFYGGSLLSWTGLWIQRIAVDWFAWQLTHSPAWVGVLAFCNLFPSVIISPIAGAIADRVDRQRMTSVTQLLCGMEAVLLIGLIESGHITVQLMATLEVLLGLLQAFQQPARQCLVPGLVPRSELTGAVALNSLTYNLARFIGPAISGPIVALWGVVPAIAVNAACYAATSASMPLLRLPPEVRRGHPSGSSVWAEALTGLSYVARHPGMGPLFLFAACMGLCLRSVPEMLSPFVAQLFGRGAGGLAIFSSTMGIAALMGGLLVAMRGRVAGLARVSVGAGTLLVVATAGFVATRSFEVAVMCIAVMGAATTMHGIAAQTLLQSSCSSAMLGRVISLWGMVVRAMPALGALIFGSVSELVGLRLPVLVAAGLAAGVSLWAWRLLPRIAPAIEAPPP